MAQRLRIVFIRIILPAISRCKQHGRKMSPRESCRQSEVRQISAGENSKPVCHKSKRKSGLERERFLEVSARFGRSLAWPKLPAAVRTLAAARLGHGVKSVLRAF